MPVIGNRYGPGTSGSVATAWHRTAHHTVVEYGQRAAGSQIVVAPPGVSGTPETTLVVQDATHGHAVDNVTLTQQHSLVVQDATHAHAADNATLTMGGSAITAVQSAISRSGSAAFASPVTAGNLLIATVTTYIAQPIAAPTDTLGHTYVPAQAQQTAGLCHQRTFYVQNCTGGANTVSCATGSGSDRVLVISEWSGMATSGALDAANQASGTGTAANGGAVTPLAADSLVYASVIHDNGTISITEDTAQSFILLREQEDGGGGMVVGTQYKIVSSTSAVTPSWTLGASHTWGGQAFVFEGSGVAGPTNLVVNDATHGHAADSPSLTQVHSLAVQDATHGHSADSPAPTQAHTLVVADARNTQTADNVVLTQGHVLSVQEARHTQAADSPTLTQAHTLTVQDARNTQTADNVPITQSQNLTVAASPTTSR
jgi:hypothetical protein